MATIAAIAEPLTAHARSVQQMMRAVAIVNPVQWVVRGERALLAGDLAHPDVLWGAVAALAVAVVGLAVGVRAMKRSS